MDMKVDDEQPDTELEGGEPWPAWNPNVFVGDNMAQNNQANIEVPQHPVIPQHHIDMDLLGSSMRF